MSKMAPLHAVTRKSSEESIASFKTAPDEEKETDTDKFSPEEEATLLQESNDQKTAANSLFGSARYSEAIGGYEKALASCPAYLEYEIAVLRCNISVCHLKLHQWKEAIDAATSSFEALARLDKAPAAGRAQQTDIERIRTKALFRRARARSELGGWANLQAAQEDYKQLQLSTLRPAEVGTVNAELAALPSRIDAAKSKEMAEMMGKLKDLGNGILRPFGLSTDNFKMTKDPKTGGYSMNFQQ